MDSSPFALGSQALAGLRFQIVSLSASLRRGWRGWRINRYTVGKTNNDSSGAVIIPPTIGAAMRCITYEPLPLPLPLPTTMGTRPPMITATVIAFARTRSTAPSRMASSRSSALVSPLAIRASQACFRYSSMITPNYAATPASAVKLIAPTTLRL